MKHERFVLGSLLTISLAVLAFLYVATHHSDETDVKSNRPFPVVTSAKDLALKRYPVSLFPAEIITSTSNTVHSSHSLSLSSQVSSFISSEIKRESEIAMYNSILRVFNLSTNSATVNKYELQMLSNDEIAIVQFDSRKLSDYWMTSAIWNNYYCAKHGHKYVYYTTSSKFCMHGSEELASPWCKVKSMLR